MENKPQDLSQENRRVREKASQCIANAKALIAHLDRLELERAKLAQSMSFDITPTPKPQSVSA